MNEISGLPPGSPLLDHCPRSLPARAYFDSGWYATEEKAVWRRHWIYVGRDNDLPAMTMRRISVAGQNLILVKDQDGVITCFHNTCRHRGAELCSASERSLTSRLIVCPYHQWSYSLAGKLASTPLVSRTADFKKDDYGLYAVHVREWNGFVFVCLADEAPDFAKAPDLGITIYDNWPMADLVTGRAPGHDLARFRPRRFFDGTPIVPGPY